MSVFRDRIIKIFFAAFLLLFSTSSLADYKMTEDSWKVEIAPYIWAINMNGTVQTGPLRAHVDETFGDIFKHLNFAGMVYFDVSKDNVELFANVMYAVLTDSGSDSIVYVHVRNKFAIITAGLSTEIYKVNFGNTVGALGFDPYIGFRTTINNVATKLEIGRFTFNANDNQDWTDAIIGMKLPITLTKAWSIVLAGDVGGMNTTTQYSYNVQGLLGYKPQSHWTNTTIYLGYRLLDQHYQHGSGLSFSDWNMKIQGPLLGLAIDF
jgi:hypothetical protein